MMFFARRSIEKCRNDAFQDAQHDLLFAEGEVEAYQVAMMNAMTRVEMLRRRLARLEEQRKEKKDGSSAHRASNRLVGVGEAVSPAPT